MRQNHEVSPTFRREPSPAPHPMADAPAWFTSALEQTPEHSTIDVDGCPIHVRTWGNPDKPPLAFVHGGGAHSGWWDHIDPFFARTHRVSARNQPEYASISTAYSRQAAPVCRSRRR
jgi:hypothetical protein